MRRVILTIAIAMLAGTAGCATTGSSGDSCCCCSCKKLWNKLFHRDPSLKPPPKPEVLVLPPEDDSRFSSPIAYPKEFQDMRTKREKDQNFNPLGDPTSGRSSIRSNVSGSGMNGRGF